jgi:hypothetical protein
MIDCFLKLRQASHQDTTVADGTWTQSKSTQQLGAGQTSQLSLPAWARLHPVYPTGIEPAREGIEKFCLHAALSAGSTWTALVITPMCRVSMDQSHGGAAP